jgi:organic radical activating enzyme
MFNKTDRLDEMIAKTNSVSPSFCMAKWMHATINLESGHTQSCHLPSLHKIPIKEIKANASALHNTQFKKLQRKKMLNGERPAECKTCWAIEDLPGKNISDRLLRSVDRWTLPYFEIVPKMNWSENLNPSYLEVSFSKTCNMKCSYCSPNVSSAWENEIKKLGPYVLTHQYAHNKITNLFKNKFFSLFKKDENEYINAFWKWWPSLVQDLMYFRITGGEPLLSNETFKIFNWFNQNPQPKLGLSINSNLQVSNQKWNQFLEAVSPLVIDKKVYNFLLHTSIDNYGSQAEYIRFGLDFFSFEKNLEEFLEKNPTCSAAIMCTFNNLSVVGFRRLVDWIIMLRKKWKNKDRDLYLDLPHLQEPFHQSLLILPSSYIRILEDDLSYMIKRHEEGFIYKSEIIQLERIIEWMKSNLENNNNRVNLARKNFYIFFNEHDRRRGTNFLKTFPEMENFWHMCQNS